MRKRRNPKSKQNAEPRVPQKKEGSKMKRKCYALLALLLAVCMVLPMGVFVGADNTTPKMKIEVSGNIGADDKVTTTYADYTDGSINLALDGTANVKITVPNGYTLQTPQGDGKGVTGITGNGNTYNIVAVSTRLGDSDTYRFTATKTGEKDLVATLKVNILEKQITDVTITAEVNSNNVTLANNMSFNPGETITVKSVQISYNDGTTKNSYQKIDPESITVTGGMKDISFLIVDDNDLEARVKYDIFVLGKEIKSIDVTGVANRVEYKDNETANLKDNIIVRATYADEKSVTLDSADYDVNLYISGKKVDYSITKDNYKELSFTITYDGFTTENALNVSNYISYSSAKPIDLSMTFGKNAKKDWVEGQTLDNFNDVTVTISYDNDKDVSYSNSDIAKLNLSISKFVYGDNYITVEYTEGGKTISKKVSTNGLTISKKLVDHLEITAKPKKTDYTEGDKLDLDGMEISLIYNNGEKEALPYSYSKFSCSPANGSILSAGTTTVYVIYKDSYVDSNGKTQSIEKSVNMALSVKKAGKKLNSADLAWGSNGKTEYFVGESFKPSGFRVTLFFNDGTKESFGLDSAKLTVTYSIENGDFKSASSIPSFTKAQSAYVIAKIKYSSYGEVELQIPVSVTKRPNLKAITAICTKTNDDGQRDGYFVGDMPSVRDFEITVYYDDNSTRTFVVGKDETVSTRTPYSFTRKEDGVTYTVKLSPYTIAEDTKKITVSYNEYVTIGTKTNKTVETEVEVKVTVPDCILKHYTSSRNYETKAYESLYDALVDASDTYYDEIQLCRDVTMSTDYASRKTLEIDLNGHTLTMVRGELYVASNASSTTKITFSNSSRDDAHIRYTNNEDDDVIVAYNKEYVIDRNSKGDGRYDVTITSVKNGKVTGPTEVIHGHDAKFTITPDEGYEIASIKVNSKTYKAASDNTLLIEDVREKLTVTVTFQEKEWQNPFTDVSKYATYYKAVQFVYEEGLFNGTSATKFEPDTTMTRAMFVTVLGRLAGVNVDNYKTSSFSDVATGQWYSEYVEWASSIGLVEGYGNGKFGPNDSITHAQMYVLMERYADIIEGKNTVSTGTSISANDVRDIPDWAYEAVEYAAKKDFLVVSSYKLTPNDNAKRSELAMLLQKFCKNVLEFQ